METIEILGNEYKIDRLSPVMGEQVEFGKEMASILTYYGMGEMLPTLKVGDQLLLKKRSNIPDDSEVYLLQYGKKDNAIVGRLHSDIKEDYVYLSYDNPSGLNGIKGQSLKKQLILGVWEVIASCRVHKQIVQQLCKEP